MKLFLGISLTDIYFFKVKIGYTRTIREMCLKLTINTPEQRQWETRIIKNHTCLHERNFLKNFIRSTGRQRIPYFLVLA